MTTVTMGRVRAAMRALGTAAMFVLVLEVCARIEDAWTWDAPLLAPYSHDLLTVRDSLGTRNRAGYRFEKWRINSFGFRGPEIAAEPAPGVERIVVLGASETFGLFEGEDGDFPSRLRAILDSVAPGRFEVVNAARAGMVLSSMPYYYRRFVAPVKPALVVVYPTPSFYLMEDEPALGDSIRRVREPAPSLSVREGLTRSRLLPKLKQVVKSFVPVPIQETMKRRELAAIRAARPSDWVWQGVPTARMTSFEDHLARVVDAVKADGVDVVLMSHVNRLEKPRAEWTDDDRYRLLSEIMSDRWQATEDALVAVDSLARDATRRVARSRGAGYVELSGEIPPSAEFFADYSHFTDAGAERVAQVLASHLLRLDGELAKGR